VNHDKSDRVSVCPDCGGGWTFDFVQRRVYCRTCETSTAVRVTGTACEPRWVPASAGDRYCAMCDAWMRARVCKACGLDTEKAAV
jgi:hypothetical protein